jgi:hypothetical protein
MKKRTIQRVWYAHNNRCGNQYATYGVKEYGSKWLLKAYIDKWGNKHESDPILLECNIDVTQDQIEKSYLAEQEIANFY